MEYIKNFLWIIVSILLFFNAIYFSIKLNFPQFHFIKILKSLKDDKYCKISSKDSLFMSLASKIGIGSLAGIAFAIYYGGVGTIFWIWITSFLICINSFLENYLSIKYKEKDGYFYKGGPAYYIKNGLHNKKLAIIYALIIIFTYIFGFLTIQTNTIIVLVNDIFSFNKLFISFITAIISFIFIYKGLKSISNICNKIVPFMSIIYAIIGFVILAINIDKIPNMISLIVNNAFNSKSISGGILPIFIIGMQKSIFSSEAGIGTGAIASGTTDNNDPIKQGYLGITCTYFINLVVTTITAFVIILSDYGSLLLTNINGVEITKYAFSYHLGYFGEIILLVLIVLFAFSTIITGYYYSESNLKLIFNNKFIILFKFITFIILIIGGVLSSKIIWYLIDFLIAILSLINLYAIFKLRSKIK